LLPALALGGSGCISTNSEVFEILKMASDANQKDDELTIISFAPEEDPVRVAADGTQLFLVSPSRTKNVTFVYELNGVVIEGQTQPLISISGSALPDGNSTLKATATASDTLETASHTFNIVKNSKPSIGNPTPSLTSALPLAAGGTQNFTAAVSDTDGDEITITWTLGSDESEALTGTTANGTTRGIFQPTEQMVGERSVRLSVSDGYDESVYEWPVSIVPPVEITSWTPVDNPVVIGSSGTQTFAVNAEGAVGATYLWEMNGAAVTGEESAFLNLDNAALGGGNHTLKVTVSNAGGSDSHTFNLKKNTPPYIADKIPSTNTGNTMATGQGTTFSVDARDADNDTLTYTWKFNGVVDNATDPMTGTGASRTVTPTSAHIGPNQISVTISDGRDEIVQTWTATVTSPVTITDARPQGNPVTVRNSGTTTFEITTAGGTGITYEWFLNGSKINGQAASSYILTNNTLNVEQTYQLKARASSGSMTPAEYDYNVIRNRLPVIGSASPASSGNLICRTCTLALSASATDPDSSQSLSWSWKVDGVEVPAAFTGSGNAVTYRPVDLAASLPADHLITGEVSDGVDTATTAWSVSVFENVTITGFTPALDTNGEVVFAQNATKAFAVTPSIQTGVSYSYVLGTGAGAQTLSGTAPFQTLSYADLPGTPGSTPLFTANVSVGDSNASQVFTLRKNAPPFIAATTPLASGTLVPHTADVLITVNSTDVDNQALTYQWFVNDSSNPTLLNAVLSGYNAADNRTVTYNPRPEDVGTNNIKVRVSDGYDSTDYTWQIGVAAPVLIQNWEPLGNPVKIGTGQTKVFSVNLGAGASGVTYNWKLCTLASSTGGVANCASPVVAVSTSQFFGLNGADLGAEGSEYLLTLNVSSTGGTDSHTFAIKKNRVPVVTATGPVDSSGAVKQFDNQITYSSATPLTFSITATDPDTEDSLGSCGWKMDGNASALLVGSSNGLQANFSPNSAVQGYHTITAECSDGYDTRTATWQVQVTAPIAITAYAPTDALTIFGANTVKTFSVTTNMNSGVTYQYKINSNGTFGPVPASTNNFVELDATALPLNGDNQLTIKAMGGGGEATQTFMLRKNTAPTVLAATPSTSSITIPYTISPGQDFWITPTDPNGDTVSVTWKLDGQISSKLAPFAPSSNAGLGRQASERGARLQNMTIADAASHIVTVELFDQYDTYTYSWSVNVIAPSTIDNYSPRDIDFPPENKIRIGAASPTTFSVTTTGASGPQYAWNINGGSAISGATNSFLSITSSILPNLNPTANTLRVVVTPTQGPQDSHDFLVYRNRPPVITGNTIAAQLTGGTGTTVAYGPGTLDLSVAATDADNDALTYNWKIDGIAQPTLFSAQNASGSQTVFTPTSSWAGQRTISVEVSDTYDVTTASVPITIIPPVTVTSAAPSALTVLGASGTQSFSVTPSSGTGVTYSYVINPSSTPVNRAETTSFISILGSDFTSSGTHFLRTILRAGGSQANHDFVIRKNQPPQVSPTSPDTFPQTASVTIPKTILDANGNNRYTFSVGVNDADDPLGNMVYTWRLNGQTGGALIASGNSAYIIPNGMVGTHSVSVDVSDGYDTTSRTWTVTVVEPVLISSYLPGDNVRVPAGGQRTLSVIVGGGVAPTYSWYLGASAPVPCSGTPGGTSLNSALSSVTVQGSQVAGSATAYALVSANGTCDSKNFTLTRNTLPVAAATTPAPAGTLVAQNGSVTFQVQATDANSDSLSYTWYFDDDATAVSLTAATPTDSYTAARTYTPQATHSAGGGHHVVKVDIWDGYDTTSYSWALTVVPPVSIVSTTPPNLDGNGDPINYVFGTSTSRTFSVTPSYVEGVTYSYKLNGVNRPETTSYISLTGSDAGLNIGNNTLEIRVTAGGAFDTETFYLVKNAPPAITPWTSVALESTTSRPRTTGLSLAWSATQAFHVEASDTDALTYSWKLNGQTPAAGVFTGSGADVTFDPPDSAGIQSVSVTVADPYDSTTYSWSVEVLAPVDIISWNPSSGSAVYGANSSYTFAVTPNATSGVSYSYQLNYTGPGTAINIPISATSPFLVLNASDLASAGDYTLRVTASNNGSSDFQDFSIRKNSPPELSGAAISPSSPNNAVNLNTSVTLSVSISDEAVDMTANRLSASWTINGAAITGMSSTFPSISFGNDPSTPGNKLASLTFFPNSETWVNTQNVRVTINDTFDSVSQDWAIVVVNPVETQITGSIPVGCAVDGADPLPRIDILESTGSQTLTVLATGKNPGGRPLDYQWYKDGSSTAIPGATTSSLTIDTNTLKPSGGDNGTHTYRVVVSDYADMSSTQPDTTKGCTFTLRKNIRPRLYDPKIENSTITGSYPVAFNTSILNSGSGPRFSMKVEDANQDSLTWEWSFNGVLSTSNYAAHNSLPYVTPETSSNTEGSVFFNPRSNGNLAYTNPHALSVRVYDGIEWSLPNVYNVSDRTALVGANTYSIDVNQFSDICNTMGPGKICTLVGNPDIGHGLTVNSGNQNRIKIWPSDIEDDGSGNLFISDPVNHVVWFYYSDANSVNLTRWGTTWTPGRIGVILGNGSAGINTSSPVAETADVISTFKLNSPRGLAWDPDRNTLYVADQLNHRVVALASNRNVTMVLGNASTGGSNFVNNSFTLGTSRRCIHPTSLSLYRPKATRAASPYNHKRSLFVSCLYYNTGSPSSIVELFLDDSIAASVGEGSSFPTGYGAYLTARSLFTVNNLNNSGVDVDPENGNVFWTRTWDCSLFVFNRSGAPWKTGGWGSITEVANNAQATLFTGCPGNPGYVNRAATNSTVIARPSSIQLYSSTVNGTAEGVFVLSDNYARVVFVNFTTGTGAKTFYLGGIQNPFAMPGSRVGNAVPPGTSRLVWNNVGTGGGAGFASEGDPAYVTQINPATATLNVNLPVYYPGLLKVSSNNERLYLGDFNNNRVRYMDLSNPLTTPAPSNLSQGAVTTLIGAGQRKFGYSEASGASVTLLNEPFGLAVDSDSKLLFFADKENSRIRKVDLSTGIVSVAVGKAGGGAGSTENLEATEALLNRPRDVTLFTSSVGSGGSSETVKQLLFTDTGVSNSNNQGASLNCLVRVWNRFTSNNFTLFSQIVGSGRVSSLVGDYIQGCGNGTAGWITPMSGSGTGTRLTQPWSVVSDGVNMYVSMYLDHCIVRVDAATGVVNGYIGTCGTLGGVGVDPLYSASETNPGALPSTAYLNQPQGIALDPEKPGNLFVADYANNVIRYVNVQGSPALGINDWASYPGNTNPGNFRGVVGRLNLPGITRPMDVAAFGDWICVANGVRFNNDYASAGNTVVCFNRQDNFPNTYITMGDPNRGSGGTFTTSLTDSVSSQEGQSYVKARFWGPNNIEFDTDGNLYISDQYNHIIRKVRKWW